MKLKHYLIASEHNDYRPWILTPAALGVFCLVIWGLRFFGTTSMTLASASIDANELMNRVNNERTQRFIPALTTNTKLISAASSKASDMLKRSYFAHIDPDGKEVWPRIENAGYKPWITLGENLAMDFDNAPELVAAWMNSPSHRENIVNPKFEDQGLSSIAGSYAPSHDTVMVVSLFGTLVKSNPVPAKTQSSAKSQPAQTPASLPVIQNPPANTSKLKISEDVKVTNTTLSGHTLVDINLIITGEPTLVTANLNHQSISLIGGKVAGEYEGRFTFDSSADLSNQSLNVEARDKNGIKATLNYPVSFERPAPATGDMPQTIIPISNETQIIQFLRITFGIFATIYMAFLAIDAIIIHRTKIKRDGVHSMPHVLVFLLVAIVTLFTNWF
jgi:hypothetical protein